MQKTVKSRNHSLVLFNPLIRLLLGATTPGQSGSESDGNERVLHIPQISKAGASPSDCLMSYPEHSLGGGGGARGVIVIVVGNEHGNTSSNPGRG